MPFTKEQYQLHYQKIKTARNKKRREQYLAQKQVDENFPSRVDETWLNQVDEKLVKVDKNLKEQVDERFNNRPPEKVDETRWTKTPDQVDEINRQPIITQPTPPKKAVVDHPPNCLDQLVKEWQTATNYNCPPTCLYSYCSNCWYFIDKQLVNYKGL